MKDILGNRLIVNKSYNSNKKRLGKKAPDQYLGLIMMAKKNELKILILVV